MKRLLFLAFLCFFTFIKTFSADYYWVGGTGNWSDINHWVTSSGGSINYTIIPSSNDNVYFDVNSFTTANQVVTVNNTNAVCANLDWTDALYEPTFKGINDFRIYGSLTLIPNMNWNYLGELFFEATTTGHTITSEGNSFQNNISFEGIGGGWILQDSCTTKETIYFTNGSLNTNSKNVNCKQFISDNTNNRILTLGSSILNIQTAKYEGYNNFIFNSTNCLLSAGTSNIIISNNFRGITIKGSTPISFHNIEYINISYECNGYLPPVILEAPIELNKISLREKNSCLSEGAYEVIIDSLIVYDACKKSIKNSDVGYFSIKTIICEENTEFIINSDSNDDIDKVLFKGNNGLIKGVNSSFNTVEYALSNGEIYGNNTFETLTLSAGNTISLEAGSVQTITNSLNANGSCANRITLQSTSIGNQATLSKASGSIDMSGIIIQDINTTGGAVFTANNSIDLGNNTNITIYTSGASDLYWVGGSGHWSDANHWSVTSGGTGGSCIPSPLDNVYFDANSFSSTNQTVTVDIANAVCKDMVWTNASFTPTFYGINEFQLYGSLELSANMNWNYNGQFSFVSTNTGNTILSANNTFKNDLIFRGIGGGWSLLDDFSTEQIINFSQGELYTNGNTINCSRFISDNTNQRSIYLYNSIINISNLDFSSAFSINGDNCTFDAGTSTMKISARTHGIEILGNSLLTFNNLELTSLYEDCEGYSITAEFHAPTTINNFSLIGYGINLWKYSTSAITIDSLLIYDYCPKEIFRYNSNAYYAINTIICNPNSSLIINTRASDNIRNVYFNGNLGVINGDNNSFNEVVYNSSDGEINGNNTFNTLSLSPGNTFILEAGATQTVNSTLLANGSCTKRIALKSSIGSNQATISKASGNVDLSGIIFQDINATGSAVFIANSSIDLGNNTGITINSTGATDLYWVGGSGNWSDANHWSTTSGGIGGACIPSPLDNVHFDLNSFSSLNNVVTIDVANAACRDMDWSGALYTASIIGENDLQIYGSLTLIADMVWDYNGDVYFKAASLGHSIRSNGNVFISDVYFDGVGGGWELIDSLNTSAVIFLENGSLSTNDQTLNCDKFITDNSNHRELILGNSTLNIKGTYYDDYDSFMFDGTNCNLDAGTSTIKIQHKYFNCEINGTTSLKFYNIEFKSNAYSCRSSFYNKNLNLNAPIEIKKLTMSGNNARISKGDEDIFIDSLIVKDPCLKRLENENTGRYIINTIYCMPNTKFILNTDINNTINNILFNGDLGIINGDNSVFQKVEFKASDSEIYGNNNFDTLIFSAGIQVLEAGMTQTVNDSLSVRGNSCFPITLQSSISGVQSTISMPGGTVLGDFIELRDQNASGGATFYTGNHSTNISNNTGWDFNTVLSYSFGLGTDTTICSNDNIQLNTDNFNGGSTFEWQDGSTNSKYLVNAAGSYSVKVGYGNNCYISDTIIVDMKPSPLLTVGNDTSLCINDSINLIAKGGTTYNWTGPNSYTSNKQNPTILNATALNTGFYIAVATADNGCQSFPDTMEVTVNTGTKPVEISITESVNDICENDTVVFSADILNGGSAPIYRWVHNGIDVGSNASSYRSDKLVNGDSVRCYLTSNSNCADPATNPAVSDNIYMVVAQNLPVSISIEVDTNNVCEGTDIQFLANPTNEGLNPSYQWQINKEVVGTNNTTLTISPDNEDIVSCTLISSETCTDINPVLSNEIAMKIYPVNLITSITEDINDICEGTPVEYVVTNTNGGSSVDYQWQVNNIDAGTNDSVFSYTPSTDDKVNCIVTSHEGCTNGKSVPSNTISMLVNENLPVSINIEFDDNKFYLGEEVSVQAYTENEGSMPTYEWRVNNKKINNMEDFNFSNSDLNDGDTITCILTSDLNCLINNNVVSNSIVLFYSTDTIDFAMPNAFVPNSSGPTGGYYTQGDNDISIFRPVTYYEDFIDYRMQVFNRWGNYIFESTDINIGWDGYYNGKPCPQGTYTYRIIYALESQQSVIKSGSFTLIK